MKNVIGVKYLISKPDTDGYEAVLRGNLLKNEFLLFDNGFNPSKGKLPRRKQLASITFTKNNFFSTEPYDTKMILPQPFEDKENAGIEELHRYLGVEQKNSNQNELKKLEESNLR